MTWTHKTLERLRMDHPNASMAELVVLLSDEAIKEAYMPLHHIHARAANQPVDIIEKRIRNATSRKEKLLAQNGYKPKKQTREPVRSDYAKADRREQARLAHESSKRLEAIRSEGPKNFRNVHEEYISQGFKPVKCIDGDGLTYIKYIKA